MALNDIYAVTVEAIVHDRRMSNTFAYRMIGGADSITQTEDLNQAAQLNLIPPFVSALSEDVQFQRLYSRKILEPNPDYEPGPPEVGVPFFEVFAIPDEEQLGAPLATPRTGDAMPTDTAYIMRLIQVTVNARHNGRAYIYGVSEDDTQKGELESTFFGAEWEALRAALEGTIQNIAATPVVFQPVVVSRWEGGILRTGPRVYDVAVVGTQTRALTQRRRRSRRKVIGVPPPP